MDDEAKKLIEERLAIQKELGKKSLSELEAKDPELMAKRLGMESARLPTDPKPFTFVRMDDLAKERKPIDWLVKDIIEVGTHGMLFGDPECGKTLILYDLLYCVAAGMKWRGRRVKQGAVFYLCGEGRGGLGRRADAWRRANQISDDQVVPFFASELPAQLLDRDSARMVCEAIEAMCSQLGVTPVAIGIDTLARNLGAGNENSAEDIGQFVQHLDELLIGRLGCAVITNHHTGHQDKERARGSMALPGALDVSYQVSKTDSVITMECKKSKDFGKAGPFDFRLKVVDLGYCDDDGDPVTGATVESIAYKVERHTPQLKGIQHTCYQVLEDHYDKTRARLNARGQGNQPVIIDFDFWKKEVIKQRCPFAQPGDHAYDDAKRQVNRAVKILLDKGYVKRRDDGISVYPAAKE